MAASLTAVRDRYNRFFVDHEIAWELVMAALSIAFVVVGYVSEGVPERDALQYVVIEIVLTAVFMIEFFSRFAENQAQAYDMLESLAEQAGGRLTVRSQPGEGTTVELEVPR